MRRAELAAVLARGWNQVGIRYAVVHGIQGYPERVGRDIDILVHPDDSHLMVESTLSALAAHGWLAAMPPDTWGQRVIALLEGSGLELHAVTELTWREVQLVELPIPRRFDSCFPVDPWASYVKQILLPGFHGDAEKVLENDGSDDLSADDRSLISESLAALVLTKDEDLARSVAYLRGRQLVDRLPHLRSALVRRSWQEAPLRSVLAIYRKLRQRAGAVARQSGVTVRLISMGETKAQEIEHWLNTADRSIFTELVYRRFATNHRGSFRWLVEALRSLVQSYFADRRALGGQRIVVHLWTEVDQQELQAVAKLIPIPDVVIVLSTNEHSDLTTPLQGVSQMRWGSEANQVIAEAIEGFLVRHALA